MYPIGHNKPLAFLSVACLCYLHRFFHSASRFVRPTTTGRVVCKPQRGPVYTGSAPLSGRSKPLVTALAYPTLLIQEQSFAFTGRLTLSGGALADGCVLQIFYSFITGNLTLIRSRLLSSYANVVPFPAYYTLSYFQSPF